MEWFWPNKDDLNDYPDPIGFFKEWTPWRADLAESPPVSAEVFSREYIQNSFDAVNQQNQLLKNLGRADLQPDKNEINFKFVKLEGEVLKKFLKTSGIDNLRQRYKSMSVDEKSKARLGASEFLNSENTPESLTILVCNEVGGVGMFGHWWTNGAVDKSDSLLKMALIQTQSEKGAAVSGGSWGHGKKAIANASKSRLLLVYTCFIRRREVSENDSDLTRRAVGVAYWKSHVSGAFKVQGLGIFGRRKDRSRNKWNENFMPLDDNEADGYVKGLGLKDFKIRDSNIKGDCGTTYVIIEPVFTARDLADSIERNWWPLLLKEKIEIIVHDEKGDLVDISPRKSASLQPFISAFELAEGKRAAESQEFFRQNVEVLHKTKGTKKAGNFALVSDATPTGWSWSEIDGAASLVALIRGGMVIAYQPSPPKRSVAPYLRGVFVVDTVNHNDAAKILRMTEPHLHNAWEQTDGLAAPDDHKFAADLLTIVDEEVRKLRNKIKGTKKSQVTRFEQFAKIFRTGKSGVVPPPKPRPPRLFTIQFTPVEPKRIKGLLPTTLKLEAACQIGLKAGKDIPKKLRVNIALRWSVAEDGLKDDPTLINESTVVPPPGFKKLSGGVYQGDLRLGEPVSFKWTSKEFPVDWSVAPTPIVEEAKR